MSRGYYRIICLGRPKKCLFFILLFIVFGLVSYLYLEHKTTIQVTSRGIIKRLGDKLTRKVAKKNEKKMENKEKIILAWTTKSGRSKWIPNTLKNLNCPINRCKITEDRRWYAESDAVIFHAKDVDINDLPSQGGQRSEEDTSKIWALLNHEPPAQTSRHILGYLDSQIDWTISYRTDSTIYAPIYRIEKRNHPPKLVKRMPKKLATWLVSHCKTSSNREGLVKEMQRYINVDIWGRCGKKLKSCPKQERLGCYAELSKKYFFYLSYENSLCKDYLTEKIYLALQVGIVPVVFGGADYTSFLPHNSYIDALAFERVVDLTDYLNWLSRNSTIYEGYLSWKKEYRIVERRYKWLCDLCQKLNTPINLGTRNRPELLSWWFTEGNCTTWKNNSISV